MQANPQQPVALTSWEFVGSTRSRTKPVVTNQAYQDGGLATIPMPRTGLGYKVYIKITASIVLAATTVTGGTWASWAGGGPFPFSILKNITYGNNQNVSLINVSGIGWYLWQRTRRCMDFLNTTKDAAYTTNVRAVLGVGQTLPAPGAAIAAGTYTFNMIIPLPLAYNDMGDIGLLVQQSGDVIFNLGLQFGQISGGISATGGTNDIFTGLTGTGITVTPTITYSVSYEYYDIIPGTEDLTSKFMAVSEIINTQINAGANKYQFPNTEIFTNIVTQTQNGGTPTPLTDMTNIQMRHNGQLIDYEFSDAVMMAGHYYDTHGIIPVDGSMVFDFGLTAGLPTRRDLLQVYNASDITDLELDWNMPGNFVASSPTQRIILEQLRTAS